jgi:ATP-binding cassette, subfamily B, bacterial HlyB/CyaB
MTRSELNPAHLVWAMGSLCALNRIAFDAELLLKQFPPPCTTDHLVHAARALGLRVKLKKCKPAALGKMPLPCLAPISGEKAQAKDEAAPTTLALITRVTPEAIHYFEAGANTPSELTPDAFAQRYLGQVLLATKQASTLADPDSDPQAAQGASHFGFRWFLPALLKHKKVWRDVLLASLVIQLLALGTPLFTQTIIDKVVAHRTESTLIAIAFGMTVFMVFSALLSWVRQYLVLHTGNRVDAVLAAAVFEHLFKLPPRYFEKRPTGVISARLHGVETIREFIASAAVTLVLDLPFLLIFVGIMFWYSVSLTLLVLGILAVIVGISLVLAPIFQAQLNQQFLLGARNQAFVTEYIAGLETVKACKWSPSSISASLTTWPTTCKPPSKPANSPTPTTPQPPR